MMQFSPNLEAWLKLALAKDIGPIVGNRLLQALRTAEAIFSATSQTLSRVPGMGPLRIEALFDPSLSQTVREELEAIHHYDAHLVTLFDPQYPTLLKRLDYPPLVLWVKGELAPRDSLSVSIVGPRSPSQYARLMTDSITSELARLGLTIVSGIAYGIDSDAHRHALAHGGRTLAVPGHGLGVPVYPHSNQSLADELLDSGRGALISIFPMMSEPTAGLFPLRNRIIAALTLGTLVIEASKTSGSLITARHAVHFNRVVMACPGDATRVSAQGSNRLIGEGAMLIQSAKDVLEALESELKRERRALEQEIQSAAPFEKESGDVALKNEDIPITQRYPHLDAVAHTILELLEKNSMQTDSILDQGKTKGHSPHKILQRLASLELEGIIQLMPGGIYHYQSKIIK